MNLCKHFVSITLILSAVFCNLAWAAGSSTALISHASISGGPTLKKQPLADIARYDFATVIDC